MREIVYSREATRTLATIPANTARRIREKIEQYAVEPKGLASNIKMLRGHPGYLRLRVGDWRVIFREDGVVVSVARIAPRGGAYD